MATFGQRVRELRKEKGLTQTQLADDLGVRYATVSGWERGINMPSFERLDDMCSYFDVNLGYLMGSDDKRVNFKPTQEEINSNGLSDVADIYYDMFREIAELDMYGQKAVRAIINTEMARCISQKTVSSTEGLKINVWFED